MRSHDGGSLGAVDREHPGDGPPAELVAVSEPDAFALSLRTNRSDGRPFSVADRRTAAAAILQQAVPRSDRWIGRACGLAPSTVAAIRADAGSSPSNGPRVGIDGRQRRPKGRQLEVALQQALVRTPNASVRELAEAVSAPRSTVHDTLRRLRAGGQESPGRTSADDASRSRPDSGPSVSDSFARWLAATAVTDADWEEAVTTVPVGRLYDVADDCRARARTWAKLADALERRARDSRRRST
jgi:hypothetical protein